MYLILMCISLSSDSSITMYYNLWFINFNITTSIFTVLTQLHIMETLIMATLQREAAVEECFLIIMGRTQLMAREAFMQDAEASDTAQEEVAVA